MAVIEQLAPILKAITGALVAGLSVLLASAGDLGWDDGIASLIAFLVGLGAVWTIPNKVIGEDASGKSKSA